MSILPRQKSEPNTMTESPTVIQPDLSPRPFEMTVTCGLTSPPPVVFRAWTEQIDAWWPKGHSRSGDPHTTVILERGLGGRLYERTPAGIEHAWGQVIAWDAPRHFALHWYLGSGPDQPTKSTRLKSVV